MRKVKYYISFLVIFTVVLISAGCELPEFTIEYQNPNESPTPTPASTYTPEPINPDYNAPSISTVNPGAGGLPDFVSVIARVRPSVVAITTTISGLNIFGATFTQEGAGSGWILDPSGLIVTNNHVVEGASNISVTLEDGRNFTADIVRADPVSDLAVVKVDAQNLPPALKIGDSSRLKVGEWVVAIGNSLGERISATKGIVSALGVAVSTDQGDTLYDLIQTDAAINPGNSGGPLVNLAGEVIGINSIKVAQVGVEGMGYAISSQVALPILDELVKNGYVTRPWLGVSLYTVDQTAVRQLNLGVDKGVLIRQIVSNGPAVKAGLKRYDVITNFAGKDVAAVDELVREIRSHKVGDTVKLTYWRGSSQHTISLTLEQSPPG